MLSGKDTEQMVDEPQTEDGDEWFDAQEEHWFDCKEWSVPEQKSTTSPYEEAKETEEKKPKKSAWAILSVILVCSCSFLQSCGLCSLLVSF